MFGTSSSVEVMVPAVPNLEVSREELGEADRERVGRAHHADRGPVAGGSAGLVPQGA